MKIQNVDVSVDELKEFQDSFIGSTMANLIGRVLNEVMLEAQGTLENTGAGMDSIRQAQGMLVTIRRFDEITTAIAKRDPEVSDEDILEGETDDLGGADVRF